MAVRLASADLDKRRAAINTLKERVRKLRVLADGREGDFWKELAPIVQRAVEVNERFAQLCMEKENPTNTNGDYADARLFVGKAKYARELLDTVKSAESMIEQTEDQIRTKQAEINRAEKNGGMI